MKSEKWTKVAEQAKAAFQLKGEGIDAGINNAEVDNTLLAFRKGQSQAHGSCHSVKFRPQDVEPLLDQAISILDRAQSDLATAQNLGEKYANLKCELEQFFALDKILDDEELAGRYSVQHDVSLSQLKASRSLGNGLKSAREAKYSLKNSYDDPAIVTRAGALAYYRAQYSGPIAGLGPLWNDPDQPPLHGESKVDMDRMISRAEAHFDQQIQSMEAEAAIRQLSGQVDSATDNQAGLEKQEAWDQKNIKFLTDRADRLRQLMRQKAALTVAGDLLDFRSRMEELRIRYQQQLADAYLRLKAVSNERLEDGPIGGLARLYDYRPGGKPDPLPTLADNPESFDAILAWTRRAASWLAAFTRRCNNYVLPISIKRLATTPVWEAGQKTGKWTFKLGPELFEDNERHVRVRGICGWCSNKEGPFTLDVSLPVTTRVRYESGNWSPEFQQDVKSCRIGRVLQRHASPVLEVSGITALLNASPLGEWTVTARDPISGKTDWPSDFQLDLYLTVLTI